MALSGEIILKLQGKTHPQLQSKKIRKMDFKDLMQLYKDLAEFLQKKIDLSNI